MTAVLLAPIAALCLALSPAPPTAPFSVDARSPEVTHVGGLGNLPGFWSFWSNGSLSVRFHIDRAGLYRSAVRAAGTDALDPSTGKRWPEMRLTIDGAEVHTWEVTSTREAPGVYLAKAVQLTAGDHQMDIAYTNDFGSGGADRNLFVSWVGIGPVSTDSETPPLTREEILLQSAPSTNRLQWDFHTPATASAWLPAPGAKISAGTAGLRIEGDGIVSPGLHVPADAAGVLSVTMAVNKGAHGEVRWAREDGAGLESQKFALRADGQPHVYAIDLGNTPAWNGTIRGIVVRPSDAPGAVAIIRSINLGTRAVGPADLDTIWFGADNALVRAGKPVKIVLQLSNQGPSTARNVHAQLIAPHGVTLHMPSRQTSPTIDGTHTFTWTVTANRPMTAPFRARVVTGNQMLSRATNVVFTAVPQSARAKALPAPMPPATNTIVGAYYFPGWKQGAHWGWTKLERFPERKPVLGWYNEGTPVVADWQIRWAAEHGISFFAFDWYWDRGSRSLEHGLHEGFLKSRYRNKMRFCLLWANHNPAGSASRDDLRQVTRFWIDRYFRLPEYQKIDGKPLIILFSPGRVLDDIGVEGTRTAFDEMRTMCRDAGLAGLYIAGCVGPDRGSVERMREAGFDAATGYNYPDAGAAPEDGNRPPYASAIAGYTGIWEKLSSFGLMDTIAVCDPGWDSRPWAGDDALARTGKNPALFRKMLENARTFAVRHPIGKGDTRMVLVEAWNEYGEGAAIEPHRQFGFGFLDAIRDVFVTAPSAHDDLMPEDVGQTVPQWRPVVNRTAWDFRKGTYTQGWSAMMGLSDFSVRNGAMRANITTGDPAFSCSVNLHAEGFARAVIRMSVTAGSSARLYWGTDRTGPSEHNSIGIPTIPDGALHEYTLDLSQHPAWHGQIRQLRLDPNENEAGSKVAVELIRLIRAPRNGKK